MQPRLAFEYNHPSKKATIYGEVNDLGVVEFVVQASPDSPIRGTELFRRMMLAFGDDVVAIRGVWRKGDHPSINIDKINELTIAGMPLDEAVQHAWTVTRAMKMGFSRARILGQPLGSPGNYTKVDVLIEKS